MLFLRSLVFQIVYYLNLGFWMVLWLPALVLPRQVTLELGRQWGRTSLWWLEIICGLKHEFRGLGEYSEGPVIVACKHQSVWETFVLPMLFPDFSFILKRELIFIPFFGWYLLSAEQIAIDRAKGGKLLPQLVRKSKGIFAQGRQLFIFPEGTRVLPARRPNINSASRKSIARPIPLSFRSRSTLACSGRGGPFLSGRHGGDRVLARDRTRPRRARILQRIATADGDAERQADRRGCGARPLSRAASSRRTENCPRSQPAKAAPSKA